MRKPNVAKLQAQVDAWNARYPVGTEVIVKKDDGSEVRTVTSHAATVLSGHTAVAWLRDIRGCYLLGRVRPAMESE